MKLKTVCKIESAMAVVLLLDYLLTAWGDQPEFVSWGLLWTALAAGIGVLYINYKFWRCPHCGSHLGRSWGIPRYCPHCGEMLDEGRLG